MFFEFWDKLRVSLNSLISIKISLKMSINFWFNVISYSNTVRFAIIVY